MISRPRPWPFACDELLERFLPLGGLVGIAVEGALRVRILVVDSHGRPFVVWQIVPGNRTAMRHRLCSAMHNAPSSSLASPLATRRRCAGARRLVLAGPLAQLVERHVYTVDVVGSIPAGPTALRARKSRGVGWTRERQPRGSAPPSRGRRARHPHPSGRCRTPQSAAGRARAGAARAAPGARAGADDPPRRPRRSARRAGPHRVGCRRWSTRAARATRSGSPPRATSKEAQGLESELAIARAPQERPRGCRARGHGAARSRPTPPSPRRRPLIDETNAEGSLLSAEAKRVVAEATAAFERPPATAPRWPAASRPSCSTYYDRVAARSSGAALLRARHVRGLPDGARRHRSAGAPPAPRRTPSSPAPSAAASWCARRSPVCDPPAGRRSRRGLARQPRHRRRGSGRPR